MSRRARSLTVIHFAAANLLSDKRGTKVPLGAPQVVPPAQSAQVGFLRWSSSTKGKDMVDLESRSLSTPDPGGSAVLALINGSLQNPISDLGRSVTRP